MPPAPPRRPRRWSRAVALNAAIVAAYLATYVTLRTSERLVTLQRGFAYTMESSGDFESGDGHPEPELSIAPPGATLARPHDGHDEVERTWTVALFRPCIAVEEWWLNR